MVTRSGSKLHVLMFANEGLSGTISSIFVDPVNQSPIIRGNVVVRREKHLMWRSVNG